MERSSLAFCHSKPCTQRPMLGFLLKKAVVLNVDAVMLGCCGTYGMLWNSIFHVNFMDVLVKNYIGYFYAGFCRREQDKIWMLRVGARQDNIFSGTEKSVLSRPHLSVRPENVFLLCLFVGLHNLTHNFVIIYQYHYKQQYVLYYVKINM